MADHKIGTREEWREARMALLEAEKDLTRRSDELAQQRRALPWVAVEKDYRFETDGGPENLAGLFRGRPQLVVFHFMFEPESDAGCPGCSFTADHLDGAVAHLEAADVTFITVSRAPLEKVEAYRRRMGWSFRWVSSINSDFNFDYGVSFTPEQVANGAEYNFRWIDEPRTMMPDMPAGTGMSSFALEEGTVYHTYSVYDRGTDVLAATWQLLDRTPLGRNEGWMRRHDEYANGTS